ncbi:hypothetical protein [Paenibacillus oenotherae]|nr:hypothetical protein [Paenibacillus oenotherae]
MSQCADPIHDRYGSHVKRAFTSVGTILVLFILLIIVLGGLMCW